MHCLYIGNFNETHSKCIKKRRLIGPAREKALTSIIDNNVACETYREKEAHRLMKLGMFNFLYLIHFLSSMICYCFYQNSYTHTHTHTDTHPEKTI